MFCWNCSSLKILRAYFFFEVLIDFANFLLININKKFNFRNIQKMSEADDPGMSDDPWAQEDAYAQSLDLELRNCIKDYDILKAFEVAEKVTQFVIGKCKKKKKFSKKKSIMIQKLNTIENSGT